MVNPEKHRRKAKTEDLIQDLDINILNILNENPEGVIKELSVNNKEIERIYNKMVANEGSVLASTECKKLINYTFRTDYTLETIKENYNAIKLPVEVIDEIKDLCYEALDIFKKIQELQNINLNKLGLEAVIGYELANNSAISSEAVEDYERLIRLRTDFRFLNV